MPNTVMDTGNERINRLKVVLAEKNRKGKWLAEQKSCRRICMT